MNEERSRTQKRIDDLSVQRATAAKVLAWLESDSSFEEIYGLDSRERHASRERERIARLDVQIAAYQRSLDGAQLVNATELMALYSLVTTPTSA
jgi:hypothetical protein